MRHLRMPLLAAAGTVLFTGSAQADLGDQLFELLADDGAPSDLFGISVAISGAVAIVGAQMHSDNGLFSGSAYLFDVATGRQITELLADDGAGVDFFGGAVAISGPIAIVGAYQDGDNGDSSGSAYLFDTATGRQIAKLLPNDGAAYDLFGRAVAISGATAIVGASRDDDNGTNSGSAYLFDTTSGRQIAKLLPNDGAAFDEFGYSVAISPGGIGTAIVGAVGDDDNGDLSGSAYLFDISDPANPKQIAKLLANDGAAEDRFGASVAISRKTAIVGALDDNDNGPDSGSAYLFDTTTGRQTAKLLPEDIAMGDYFGVSVAISGKTAIIGTNGDDDNGSCSGSAYLFDITTGGQLAKILPSDGNVLDHFGYSVAISGVRGRETAIVGALGGDDNGSNSGSAYLFDASACQWDLDDNGIVGASDVLFLLANWGNPYGASDLVALLANWGPCP